MNIKLNQPYSFCQRGKRDNQEDSRYPDSDQPSADSHFFIVCDGVGGEEDGEMASKAVAEGLGSAMKKHDWQQPFTAADFLKALEGAYKALNKTAADDGNADMATTLTMLCFHPEGCSMAHLGDSRIYHYRPDYGLIHRTDDHSLINELIHAGIVAPEDEDTHPQRSTISRYMAPETIGEQRCRPSWYTTADVAPGDVFFLCTDGVTDVLSDNELEQILCGQSTDEEKRDQIARRCLDSHDNNTACLVSVAQVSDNDTDETPKSEEQQQTDSSTQPIHRQDATVSDLENAEPAKKRSLLNLIKNMFNF